MKGFPKIVVALNIKKMNALTLCTKAKGVKTTGDPDVVNPPVSDTTLQQQADDVLALLKLRVTVRKKSLTAQIAVAMDILKVSYEKVGRYVEMIARHKAMETGSVDAGENVVARCGFTLKKKRQMASRTFTIVSSGSGYTHLRAKAAAKNAVYVWRFGRTSEKGVRPLEFMPIAVTNVCELIVTYPYGGGFMAYQVACVLPKPRSSKTGHAHSTLGKNALKTTGYKGNKPVVEAGTDPLQWSDFLYIGCS